jgi:hypothetical protein
VVIKKFYILGSDPKIDLLTEGSLMNVVITEIFTLSMVINGNFWAIIQKINELLMVTVH